jgi:hypothetical protein
MRTQSTRLRDQTIPLSHSTGQIERLAHSLVVWSLGMGRSVGASCVVGMEGHHLTSGRSGRPTSASRIRSIKLPPQIRLFNASILPGMPQRGLQGLTIEVPDPLADELIDLGLAARPAVRGPDSVTAALVLETLNTTSSLVTLALAGPALKRAAQRFMPWIRGDRSPGQPTPGTIHVATAEGYQPISISDLDEMIRLLSDQSQSDAHPPPDETQQPDSPT